MKRKHAFALNKLFSQKPSELNSNGWFKVQISPSGGEMDVL
jgi:hypothetical protein